MSTVTVRDAREKISELLDAVAHGESVTITRRGKAVAKLVGISEHAAFPDRSAFRASLPPARSSAAQVVRALRDDERA